MSDEINGEIGGEGVIAEDPILNLRIKEFAVQYPAPADGQWKGNDYAERHARWEGWTSALRLVAALEHAPAKKVACTHVHQKWNIFFTRGHCMDCNRELVWTDKGPREPPEITLLQGKETV